MILIVDDDAEFLESARMALPFDRLCATTAGQAMGLLRAIDFSLALVDLDLPDESGFDLINEIHTANPALPVIAISGVYAANVLESAREFGAVDVLRKPVTKDWAALVDRVRLRKSD